MATIGHIKQIQAAFSVCFTATRKTTLTSNLQSALDWHFNSTASMNACLGFNQHIVTGVVPLGTQLPDIASYDDISARWTGMGKNVIAMHNEIFLSLLRLHAFKTRS